MTIQIPRINRLLSVVLSLMLFAASGIAQQPPTRPPAPQPSKISFDDLLAVDAFKMYVEVRNVGQLMTTGGAGEIVDPIIKLADPGKEFQSIINFLKKNSEALASSRLMFASWPTRTDLPYVFVAIEFPTNEEAARFAPKLETFLPTVLPPVPSVDELSDPAKATASPQLATAAKPTSSPSPKAAGPQQRPSERLPFVITHSGSLVFISDKSSNLRSFIHRRASRSLPIGTSVQFMTSFRASRSFSFSMSRSKTKPCQHPPPRR